MQEVQHEVQEAADENLDTVDTNARYAVVSLADLTQKLTMEL